MRFQVGRGRVRLAVASLAHFRLKSLSGSISALALPVDHRNRCCNAEGELVVMIEPNRALHDVATLEPQRWIPTLFGGSTQALMPIMLRFGS